MEIPKRYEADIIEQQILNRWADEKLYAWDPTRSRDETFVVDTPPPTVSGSLHVGHMFSYSHQDFIVRFQRMRGKNIFFPIGWDDNGLPTERRVQNLYNVKCDPHAHFDPNFSRKRGEKGAPLPVSRPNFIALCNEVTREDEAAFRHLWTRLGLSYDWDQEYATIDDHCRRTSQASFLELLEKGEIYQDNRPVMWDVGFQTAIAQAEIVDKEVPSAYHFLRFGIENSAEYLVVATTRPELLPACVAVLVHPEDDRYRKFLGKRAVTPIFRAPVPIMADEKADPEKGTGVVMVCTFGDQTDVEWWLRFNLPARCVLNRNGTMAPIRFGLESEGANWISIDPESANAAYAQMEGLPVKKAREAFLALAEATEGVIDRPKQDIVHAVKFFEKGDLPLELMPTRQWYCRILDKKDALIEQGRKIQWHPEFMRKRYEHWVEGLNADWCLSRQRFFGVPIPVWYRIDESGAVRYDQVLLPDRADLPVDPMDTPPPGFTESQRNQPGGFSADTDVMDTWATSSLTPQIASHWVDDPERHRRLFPMDIRPQSHEIIRTWAFYTIVKAYLHEREIPWKHVVISGWILDPDRKKMSKSQGNVITPEPLIDQYGADSVRYWAARARLGVDTAYDEQVFKIGKKLCTKIFNASRFALGRFEQVDRQLLTPDRIITETDRAVIGQLRPVIQQATAAFEQFDYAQALSVIEDFFWRDFCDNYLELAKGRTYEETLTPERISACATLRLVHRAVIRLFAPFVPFLADAVWSWAYAEDADMHLSVHRSPWPSIAEFREIPEPVGEKVWDATLAVLDAIRRVKADANKSMAAPLDSAVITAPEPILRAVASTMNDIQAMLKIHSVKTAAAAADADAVTVDAVFAPETQPGGE